MINHSSIFDNPVVPDDFYFMKCNKIDIEVVNHIFPKMQIELVPYPDPRIPQGAIFYSVLYPGEKSDWIYKNFYNTYMLGAYTDELHKAIGMWGSVKLTKTEYEGTVYSSVKFVYQPLDVRHVSCRIFRAEKKRMVEEGTKSEPAILRRQVP